MARGPEQGRPLPVVAVASALFALALFLGDRISVWLTTAMAGGMSLLLCWGWGGLAWRTAWRGRRGQVLRGLAGGLLLAGAMHLVYPLAVKFFPVIAVETGRLYAMLDGFPGPSWAALPILTVVVFAEECVWRGVLYGALAENHGRFRAAVFSVGAYLVPQLGSRSWVTALLALCCGTAWTGQRVLAGGLLEPAISHWIWSTLVLLMFPVTR